MATSEAAASARLSKTQLRAARPGTIEQKVAELQQLELQASRADAADYNYRLEMSWIHHDNALEGVVYDPHELVAAASDKVASDASLIPVYDEIRQYKAAIAVIRELATKKHAPITLDTIKAIYAALAPSEVEGKQPPRYRKDMPLHRVYFHDITPPDKIGYQMRQLIRWLASDEVKRTMHPVRIAAKAHFKLLHIFPFPNHSGKVARLLMNMMLLRDGYPPAIVHATERQRYYEALKTSPDAVAVVVNDALRNSVDSGLRYFTRQASPDLDETA